MNVREVANRMGAKSVEKVRYNRTFKHVCWNGGQVGVMRDTVLQQASDGTLYGKCEHCQRFFYATPNRQVSSPKQFVYA